MLAKHIIYILHRVVEYMVYEEGTAVLRVIHTGMACLGVGDIGGLYAELHVATAVEHHVSAFTLGVDCGATLGHEVVGVGVVDVAAECGAVVRTDYDVHVDDVAQTVAHYVLVLLGAFELTLHA